MAIIEHKTGIDKQTNEDDLSVYRHIKGAKDKEFSNALQTDIRWPVLYHLSEMRHSLFNWYEFDPSAKLLEVGGAFGALTGLFCEKCASVTTVERNATRAEALALRHQDYQNLTVWVGDITEMEPAPVFDVVVVAGPLASQQYPSVFLQQMAQWMQPGGRLLLAAENRFGIKYWCGAPEPVTRVPFEGINGRAKGVFSQKELGEMLQNAGLVTQQFFYPMPDYNLPQAIFSPAHLPDAESVLRCWPAYPTNSTMVGAEYALYQDVIENGGMAFMMNSFLVECGNGIALSPVEYAVLSTDHPRGGQFATTVRNDGTVRKLPLHKESLQTLEKLVQNTNELATAGISTVPGKIENGALVMDRVDSPNLYLYMDELLKRNQPEGLKAIHDVFDELYGYICSSSPKAQAGQNNYPNANDTQDWDLILKTAYPEMIPLNCFYDGKTIAFYDQELAYENWPAKHVMFRAVFHSPVRYREDLLGEIKKKYGLDGLWDTFLKFELELAAKNRNHDLNKAYYSFLTTSFEGHMYENALFLASRQLNRHMLHKGWHRLAVYGYDEKSALFCEQCQRAGFQIVGVIDPNAEELGKAANARYTFVPLEQQLADVDAVVVATQKDIYHAVQALQKIYSCPVITQKEMETWFEPVQPVGMSAEIRSGYLVTVEMKNLWAVELDLLEKLLKVCKKYNLQVWAVNGTLLGAVRHKGFIPWDDDIDVMMPRKDIEKLKEVAEEEFLYPYFLQTPQNQPEALLNITRLRNSATTFYRYEQEMKIGGHKGCAIDIVALDGTYDSVPEQNAHNSKVKRYRGILSALRQDWDYRLDCAEEQSRELLAQARLYEPARVQKVLEDIYAECDCDTAKYWAILGRERENIWNKDVFAQTIWMDFEHLKIPVPGGYAAVLDALWENTEVPEKPSQRTKKIFYFDTQTPYQESDIYREQQRTMGAFNNAENMEIFVFGAGLMLNTYMKVHGKKYPPVFLFDNDPAKWGSRLYDIEIKNPEEILELMGENSRIIIVNRNYEEITKQLEDMGIFDYYYYAEGKLYGEKEI